MVINLESISNQSIEIVKKAGEFIQQQLNNFNDSHIEIKGLNQLVSFVDIETEKFLVKELGKLIPNSSFITEEKTVEENKNAEYCWIIDPLDGTTNFLHKLPVYSISVALMHQNILQIGIVYEINRNEIFNAILNNGAYLNNNPIQISQNKDLSQSLIATGFPYYDFEKMDAYLNILRELMKSTHGLRRMGSAAVDLAYTAAGRFEGFFEYSLAPWDVAAGILIAQEAGAKVYDFNGGSNYLFGKEIIACSPSIEKEFLTLIKNNFYPN